MSHWTQIKTTMRDPSSLADALRELYPGAVVDVARSGITIYGYQGQQRIGVVAVRGVGAYWTDIGFTLDADGTLSQIADAGNDWQELHKDAGRRLPQRYAYHQAIRSARAHGFQLVDEKTAQVARVGG